MVEENLFHPGYIRDLLKKLGSNYKVVGITLEKDVYKKGYLHFLSRQIHLWGMIGFTYIAVKSILKKGLDKLRIYGSLSLESIARENNLKFIESFNHNSPRHLAYLRKLKIDIIIVSSGQLFSPELLSIPKIACINRHTSLLPKYGGVMPVFWAMYYNEKKFGVSVHYMVEKFDQGDIIYQEQIPIMKKNSLYINYVIAFQKSVDVTLQALENVRNKKIMGKFYHNDKEYFSFPSFEKIRQLREKGYKIFSLTDILWKKN